MLLNPFDSLKYNEPHWYHVLFEGGLSAYFNGTCIDASDINFVHIMHARASGDDIVVASLPESKVISFVKKEPSIDAIHAWQRFDGKLITASIPLSIDWHPSTGHTWGLSLTDGTFIAIAGSAYEEDKGTAVISDIASGPVVYDFFKIDVKYSKYVVEKTIKSF